MRTRLLKKLRRKAKEHYRVVEKHCRYWVQMKTKEGWIDAGPRETKKEAIVRCQNLREIAVMVVVNSRLKVIY